MAKSATAKTVPVVASAQAHDASAIPDPSAHLVNRINAETRGVLVLFPFAPRSVEAGKVYPVMTGHLDTKNVKMQVSAFARMTDEGREFLSLAIGPQGQAHIGGAVFRQEEQSALDGRWSRTPGKELDRFGVISKQVKREGADAYDMIYQLRFYGRARVTAAGVPYIKANVYPERREASPADLVALDGCF